MIFMFYVYLCLIHSNSISINIAVISRENMCYFKILRGDSTIDINPSDSLDIAR